MTSRGSARTIRVAGVLVVIAAFAALSHHRPASSSWPAAHSARAALRVHRVPPGETARDGRLGALGEADGAVPEGTTVFDDDVPGVAKLDADLLAALRRAAADAAGAGVRFSVDSGWRSRAYQARLLREAIAKYGSEEQAARWVATPSTSAHVAGDAVDIGPPGAAAWLAEHGAAYGLCQTYGNEAWHYELRPEAIAHGCPAPYADPTQDPRMQR